MAAKKNPLRLNNLQLKTLTLLQELARHPETSTKDSQTGDVLLTLLPDPHGDHFHIGSKVARASDATGLRNPAVWAALARRGLAHSGFPVAITLTPAGVDYDTGLRDKILFGADHQA